MVGRSLFDTELFLEEAKKLKADPKMNKEAKREKLLELLIKIVF